ncbi:MAG: MinD/ParA family protein, partial [Lachnospiraceae bacterium]|nr:MinD/ParA family protein [Lachnospiraceae bacterium]
LKALNRHPRYRPEETRIKVVANKVTGETEAQALYAKLETVVERYLKMPISYLGMIPQDQMLAKAVMQQMPVSVDNPKARSAMAYEELAARLMNREENKTVKRRGMAAFFAHIMSRK